MFFITEINGTFHLVCAETLEMTGVFSSEPACIEREHGLTFCPATNTFHQ